MPDRLAMLNEAERRTDAPIPQHWDKTASEALIWRARQNVRFYEQRYWNALKAISGQAHLAAHPDVYRDKPYEEALGYIQEHLDNARHMGEQMDHAHERLERLERQQPAQSHDVAAE